MYADTEGGGVALVGVVAVIPRGGVGVLVDGGVDEEVPGALPNLGVVITSVSLSADPKTILPVEAALGQSVAQRPFLGAGPLLAVDGSSDFIAVTGRRLSVRALIDGAETTKVTVKILSAAEAVNVDTSHIIVIGQIEGLPETADIEDLFSTKDYLALQQGYRGHLQRARFEHSRHA
ncbi:hypothetical protein ACGFT2_06480 [Streptomyces sp. NPDC048514]|uniref:hypothetical protein n=1 Tax=Streptomyces sp. NPDC048514 TaxID=3365564 RepID=UPI003713F748